jgi:hypothetical protein
MIALALLMAEAFGAAPKPVDPQAIARLGDLTGNTLPSAHEGVTFADLSLDYLGAPIRCAIMRTSGAPGMDRRTCAALMRLRFVPARDEAGVPVASVFPAAVRWTFGGASGAPGHLLDETVEVGRLPDGAAQAIAAVRQVIGADGGVESCAVDETSGSEKLDRLACKQAEGLGKLGPIKDRAGKPVRTLRVSRIQFVQRNG